MMKKLMPFMLFAAYWMNMNVSAYTLNECPNTITASGHKPVAGITVAADHLPFGSKVVINGHTYIVQDRFGGGYTDRIDIFMNNVKDALEWGRQYIPCYVITN